MRICAIVITYHPDAKEVTDNIMRYLPCVERLLIWDNTPAGSGGALPCNVDSALREKIVFMGNGVNAGISEPLNFALRYAEENGFTHLLTMDQDSSWENFSLYRETAERMDDGRTLFGPQIIVNGPDPRLGDFSEPEMLITSGMLYPVSIGRTLEGYTDLFRIDGIDWDFSLRAREAGCRLLQINKARMRHSFGRLEPRRLLWKTYLTQNYSPGRLYEILKSHVYIVRRFDLPRRRKRKLMKAYLYKAPWRILFFEPDKTAKLLAIARGLRDGLRIPVGRNRHKK